MAIGEGGGNTVDLQEVLDEFGPSSSPTSDSLLASLQKIYGSSTGNLAQFEGTGQPKLSNFALSSKTSTTITPTITIDTNEINAQVRYYYFSSVNPLIPQESDFFTNGSTTSFQLVPGSTSDATVYNSLIIENLSPSTEYYVMVQYYNAYIDNSNDYRSSYDDEGDSSIGSGYFSVTTDAPPTLATPTSLSINSYDSLNSIFDLTWNFTDGSASPPYTFYFRYRINGGSYSTQQSFEVSGRTNWDNTSNPKGGDALISGLPNPGDIYEIQVKASKSGFTDSAWSTADSYFF